MPIAKVQMPDGRIAKFEVPEGTSPEQVTEFASSMQPPAQSSSQISAAGGGVGAHPQGMMEQLMRQVGLTSRAGIQGVTGTIGMLADPLNAALDNTLGTHFGSFTKSRDKLLDEYLPKPQTTGETIASGIVGLGFGLSDPVGGALTQAIKGAKALGGGAEALYKAPGMSDVHADMIRQAQEAGYHIPPSEAGGNLLGRLLEHVAGKTAVAKNMEAHNTGVSDKLARKAAQLPESSPLTREALDQAIEHNVDTGYAPIRNMERIFPGGVYLDNLEEIIKRNQGASNSFPGAVDNDVANAVRGYAVKSFSGGDAIDAIKGLRSNANDAFRKGNSNLGRAQKETATALEDAIDSHAWRNPYTSDESKAAVESFRAARRDIAKQAAVRDALTGEGNIDARKLGAKAKKGAPLTDELKQIGSFANAAPRVAGVSREAPPLTGGVSPALAGGLGWMTGNPWMAGVPFLRGAMAKGLNTDLAQGLFAKPKGAPAEDLIPWMNGAPSALQQFQGLFEPQ